MPNYGVVLNSQIMPIKYKVANIHIGTMELLILVEVARVEIMPIWRAPKLLDRLKYESEVKTMKK